MTTNVRKLTMSAILCAIGIVLPMVMPVKFVLEPASFTLASHVVIFIAMFISPSVAVSVAIGTAVGFFFAGMQPVIVLRAFSHVVFAVSGAFVLHKKPQILSNLKSSLVFSFLIGVLHAFCELVVVTIFYFGNNLSSKYYENGFLSSVLLLVGVGTIVHSMIDFSIAQAVWRSVGKRVIR